MDIKTIEEYVKHLYPPPQDSFDGHWNFFQSWGYEQWLIKRFGKNLEQLCILNQDNYNTYRIAAEAEKAGSVDALFKGKPLVQSKHIVTAFMCSSMPKGTVGVALWQEANGDWFCVWPKKKGSPFPQIKRGMPEDEIEFIGMNYTNEKDILELQPKDRVAHRFQLRGRIVCIPGVGVKYVKSTYASGVSRHTGGIRVVECVPGKTVEWKRKPHAPEEMVYISDEQFEDIRIIR